MSKPLELTAHPKRLVDSGLHRIEADGSWTSLRVEEWFIDGVWMREPFRTHKRLTDAELAAEFHLAVSDFQAATSLYLLFEDVESEQKVNGARGWMFCMEQFATLPHYDEQP